LMSLETTNPELESLNHDDFTQDSADPALAAARRPNTAAGSSLPNAIQWGKHPIASAWFFRLSSQDLMSSTDAGLNFKYFWLRSRLRMRPAFLIPQWAFPENARTR
jgi:hypothetical protein